MLESKSGFVQARGGFKYLSPIEDGSDTLLSHIDWLESTHRKFRESRKNFSPLMWLKR